MRGIKPTLVTAMAIGLLAGSAVNVAAQDEDPTRASFFTGTIGKEGNVSVQPTETVVDGVLQGRGFEIEGEPIQTDDPRLAGSLSRVLNVSVHKLSDFEDVVLQTFQYRVENDEGSWSGPGTALAHGGGTIPRDEATDFDTVLLTGAGAYEGLSAYLLADWTEDPVAIEGAIFAGEMPPFPEPISAEEPVSTE